ncbi:MAG: hypothetical protein AB1626_05220 [Candidatus Micrarchaeota archaeon]
MEVTLVDEGALLRKWRDSLEAYTAVDVELRKYCEENSVVLGRCDACGAPMLSPAAPEKENVLRWNFCCEECRKNYFQVK